MKKSVTIIETDVRFKVKKLLIRFKIYHNLPQTQGMNIEGAIDCWLARTKEFTAQSLCNYILSKDLYEVVAMTEKEFNRHKKEGKISV